MSDSPHPGCKPGIFLNKHYDNIRSNTPNLTCWCWKGLYKEDINYQKSFRKSVISKSLHILIGGPIRPNQGKIGQFDKTRPVTIRDFFNFFTLYWNSVSLWYEMEKIAAKNQSDWGLNPKNSKCPDSPHPRKNRAVW